MSGYTAGASASAEENSFTFQPIVPRCNDSFPSRSFTRLPAPSEGSARKLGPPQRTPIHQTPSGLGAARRVPQVDSRCGPKLKDAQEDFLCQAFMEGVSVRSTGTQQGNAGSRGIPQAAAEVTEAASAACSRSTSIDDPTATSKTQIRPSQENAAQLGCVQLLSPIRASKALQHTLGSDQVLTPVRRSARKLKKDTKELDVETLLECTNYSYTPNSALRGRLQYDDDTDALTKPPCNKHDLKARK